MHICPQCQHQNMEGELFCENCGLLLVTGLEQSRSTRQMAPDEVQPGIAVVTRGTQTFLPEARLVLELGDKPERHTLVVEKEITLGRVDLYTDFEPDVNLSTFGAWEHGVSRLHASIRRDGNQLFLLDLGSTNGTFLNDEQLPPRQPHLLHDGDRIRLGTFNVLVYFLYQDQIDAS